MSERCAARVYTGPGAGVSGYPCQRPGKYQENSKWWCANHAPSRVKARQEKANAAFEQRYQAETAARVQAQARAAEQARRAACYDVLLAACEAASDLIDRSPLGPDWRTNGQTDAYYVDRADMDALRTTVRAAIARAKVHEAVRILTER